MDAASGKYSAVWSALQTDAVRMSDVRCSNSSRFPSSRTSVLVVRTPTMDSLYAAVMSELHLRTWREAARIRRWKIMLTHPSGGRTTMTQSASFQFSMSMMAAMATEKHPPQTASSVPHASTLDRRAQSDVSLAISHPLGRRSKYESESSWSLAKASRRMSWLTWVDIFPPQ